jgi:hypothetical protein
VPNGAKRGFGSRGAKSATPFRGALAPGTYSDTGEVPKDSSTVSRQRYHLELEALPGNWRVEPVQRLRAALKRLLRSYGLRCVRCQPADEPRDRELSQPPNLAAAVPAVESPPVEK